MVCGIITLFDNWCCWYRFCWTIVIPVVVRCVTENRPIYLWHKRRQKPPRMPRTSRAQNQSEYHHIIFTPETGSLLRGGGPPVYPSDGTSSTISHWSPWNFGKPYDGINTFGLRPRSQSILNSQTMGWHGLAF